LEEDSTPRINPLLSFGPGMRLWLLFALYFSIQVLIVKVLLMPNALPWLEAGPEDGYAVWLPRLGLALQGLFLFAVPALIYVNAFSSDKASFFRLQVPVKPIVLILGIATMLALIPTIEVIYSSLRSTLSDPELLKIYEDSNKKSNWVFDMPGIGDLLVCILCSALIPAICEELFFRGVTQRLITEWTHNKHAAVWISAFLFSLVHFDPVGFPTILLAGLVLGYAYLRTGSLRMTIAMHFAFNAVSILIGYYDQHYVQGEISFGAGFAFAGLAIAFVLFGLIFRFTEPKTVS
jgi:uncharacterized protein